MGLKAGSPRSDATLPDPHEVDGTTDAAHISRTGSAEYFTKNRTIDSLGADGSLAAKQAAKLRSEGTMEASDRGAATHVILRPAEGRSIHLGNFAMTVKATAEETDGAFTLFEADEPPGFGPPMHIHHETAEAFYVVAGDEEFVCRAGSFICNAQAHIPCHDRRGPLPRRSMVALYRRIGTDFVNPRRDDIGGERDWQCEIDDRD